MASTLKVTEITTPDGTGNITVSRPLTGGTGVKGGDIASASPLVIDTDGDYFDVTGTTNFAAMTVAADRQFTLQFDGALTMTHHATNLDLPGEANITTAAGDVAVFQSTGANTVQCINYTKADGTAVSGGGDNTPAFSAERTGAGAITTGTWTKVAFSTEHFDTDSAWDGSEFIPLTAGKYLLVGSIGITALGDGKSLLVAIYKNGVEDRWVAISTGVAASPSMSISAVVEANGTDDDFSLYVYHDHGSDRNIMAGESAFFMGFKLNGV